jgi:two-component system, cell cycle sensor histidine kinase and response regulator CckA
MLKYRAYAIAAAVLLIIAHVVLLLLRYGTEAASVWGDWFGVVAALLAAIASCLAWSTGGPFGKRVWQLVALSCFLAFMGEVLYTYYYDYLHASTGIWPSDFLVFFWSVPAIMALFLSPMDRSTGFRWLRVWDFVQVCTLALALELSTIYIPSQWQHAEQAMENRVAGVGLIFFGLLACSFLARGLLTPFRTARRLFQRLAVFFIAFGITTNISLHAEASGHYQQGRWPDLLWTLTFCLLAIFAATWNVAELHPESVGPVSRGRQLLEQFSPLLMPVIVFPLVLRIAQEQFVWSVVLAMASFAAAGGRMFVVQNELLISSRELQKNLSLLQGITEGTTDAIFVKDLQGRYLMMNSAGARFVARSVPDVIGKTDIELFNPENGREIMERDRTVLESGTTQTYEEFGSSGGITRVYLATKGPFRDTSGKVVGLLGISRDITERKRAEEEIQRSQQDLHFSEERFYKAFDSNPEGITISTESDGRYIEVNDAYLHMMGYHRLEVLGKTALELNVWCDSRAHQLMVGELSRQGHVRNLQATLRTKSGGIRDVEISAVDIQLQGKTCLLTITRDVTQNKLLEQQLRQSQKMEAVGRLAGGVAHDFNNLLGVILGCTELLGEEAPSYPGLAKRTETIKLACLRAASLTAQLLAFSRRQTLQPEVLNLNSVVSETGKMLQRLLAEDIEQRMVLDPTLGLISADRGQIVQVIMNLAVNAGDAMPKGGQLIMETTNVILGDDPLQHGVSVRPGEYVSLAVRDTGVGIDGESLRHIFEPFYTTKPAGKGTGLGLATVSGIIEQSGGYIFVESSPGRGTTFKIYLPRVEKTMEPTLPLRADTGVKRGSETVLLVEDDSALRELIAEGLRTSGYRVLVAANGVQALQTSKDHAGSIDVLITDVIMPQMGGPELARLLAARRPGIKVLYISGYTDDKLRLTQAPDPDVALIQKPFQLTDLVLKLRQVLTRPAQNQ